MNLKVTRQTTLATINSGEEEETPARGKGFLPKREGEGVMMPSPGAEVSLNPKAKGKSTSSYKTRSQLEVPLLEGLTKREGWLFGIKESEGELPKCFLDLSFFFLFFFLMPRG